MFMKKTDKLFDISRSYFKQRIEQDRDFAKVKEDNISRGPNKRQR